MPDRLRLLKKNVETNLHGDVRGSATVTELVWGDNPDPLLTKPLPDYGNRFSYYLFLKPEKQFIFGFGIIFCGNT